jgi:hypothetical protein
MFWWFCVRRVGAHKARPLKLVTVPATPLWIGVPYAMLSANVLYYPLNDENMHLIISKLICPLF